MLVDLGLAERDPIGMFPVNRSRLLSRFATFIRSRFQFRWPSSLANFSDRDLADLHLTRGDIEPIDPREMRLF